MLYHGNSKGLSIAVVLMVLMIIIVIGLAIGTVGIHNLSIHQKDRYEVDAVNAADAGLQVALQELKTNNALNGSPSDLTNVALPTLTDCTYSVVITNNLSGGSQVNAQDGTLVPAGSIYIVSTGTYLGNTSRKVAAMARRSSPFNFAFFGDKSVKINGNAFVDSYDSSEGAYHWNPNPDPLASVGTNGMDPGVMSLIGGVTVYGSLQVGPGGSTSSSISTTGGASYTGQASVSPKRYPLSQMVVPSSLSSQTSNGDASAGSSGKGKGGGGGLPSAITPGVYNNMKLTGQNTIVLNGTYYFKGDISLAGGAQLVVTGPTIIYVDGTVDLSGGSLTNNTGTATNFHIFGTDSCTSVTLTGGAQAYTAVYARKADISVKGDSDLYGSLVGKTITESGNAPIHFDRALSEETGNYQILPVSFQRL